MIRIFSKSIIHGSLHLAQEAIKSLSVLILVVAIFPSTLISQAQPGTGKRIYGNWEYHKVQIGGEMIYVEKDLCGKKDFLEIIKPESPQIVSHEADGIEEIAGEHIGTSNNIICSINPINFEYQSGSNSCPTSWIRLQNDSNHLVSLADGIVVEYEIIRLSKKSMTLKMVREIENFGIELHERIEFRRIKSKN